MVRTGSIHEANIEDRVDGMMELAVGDMEPEACGSEMKEK